MRQDDVAVGPFEADQLQSDETLVDVDHFGHATQPLLAVEELEQLGANSIGKKTHLKTVRKAVL